MLQSVFEPARATGCASQSGGDVVSKDTVRAVRRPSGKRPLTLLIRSLNRTPASGTNVPAVLVFMLDPELPLEAAEAGLRQLYGFTASEARMGQLLMSGRTFEDCCHHLAIRPSTARMHLGNLFAKTGVQRQGQLISLLLKSLGVVRATGAGQNINQSLQGADRMELTGVTSTRERLSAPVWRRWTRSIWESA